MTGLTALVVGLGLGVRHASDADHVVVVAALLQRERSVSRAARVAAYWGAGHATTLLSAGALALLTGLRAPVGYDKAAELLVALMLIVVGARQIARPLSGPAGAAERRASPTRPVLVGMIHGLAGSAGLTLLALSTTGSELSALLYLLFVGLGSIGGMVVMTIAISSAARWIPTWSGRGRTLVALLPGALSALVGTLLMLGILIQ
jgi:nickel/cobalt transporter (NicO) family protein